jgi:hypothetical protein
MEVKESRCMKVPVSAVFRRVKVATDDFSSPEKSLVNDCHLKD